MVAKTRNIMIQVLLKGCVVSFYEGKHIWDLSSLPKAVEDPILAYSAETMI